MPIDEKQLIREVQASPEPVKTAMRIIGLMSGAIEHYRGRAATVQVLRYIADKTEEGKLDA